ncbi:MAG: hypothetical protein ACTSRP_25850, partial [Candidatus Helarchaeota archaeon]
MSLENKGDNISKRIDLAGNYIFSNFNKKKFYPCLATRYENIEHPELEYHINRMLATYLEFKPKLNPLQFSKEFHLLYDLLIKTAIIFHDLGK